MAYCNLRHRTERKGRSVILEREIFNLQSKNPCGTPLCGRMRGSIRNLKGVAKTIHNRTTAKRKFDQNRKPHAKQSKPINVHIPVRNPNRSVTVLTNGAHRGFAAIRDQYRSIVATWIEEKTESKWDNPKTPSETKSVAHYTGIFDEK